MFFRNHPQKVRRLGNVGPEYVIVIDNSFDSDIPLFAAKNFDSCEIVVLSKKIYIYTIEQRARVVLKP